MRVLAAISILAFVALLWASIAIFRHIRRASRRRRRTQESQLLTSALQAAVIAPPPPPPAVPEITFTDPEAPLPQVAFTDTQAPIRESAPPAVQHYLRQVDSRPQPASSSRIALVPQPQVPVKPEFPAKPEFTAQPELPAEPEVTPQPKLEPQPAPSFAAVPESPKAALPSPRDPSQSPLPPWPHFGFTPARPTPPNRSHAADEDFQPAARMASPLPEPIPYAAPPLTKSSSSVAVARGPIQMQPPAPAVKPLYPSSRPYEPESAPPPRPSPLRAGQLPLRRVDWAYNDDMGDLSDPPPAGSRPRIPIAKSE